MNQVLFEGEKMGRRDVPHGFASIRCVSPTSAKLTVPNEKKRWLQKVGWLAGGLSYFMLLLMPHTADGRTIGPLPTFEAKVASISSSGAITFSEIDSPLFEIKGSFRMFGARGISASQANELLVGTKVECVIHDNSYSEKSKVNFLFWLSRTPVKCAGEEFGDLVSGLIDRELAQPKCPEALGYYSNCGRTYSTAE